MNKRKIKLIAFFLLSALIIFSSIMAIPMGTSLIIPGVGITISRGITQDEDPSDSHDDDINDDTKDPSEDGDLENGHSSDESRDESGNDAENDNILTREEFASLLYSSFIYLPTQDVTLYDISESSNQDAIYALVGSDIMSAYDDNTFRPENIVSRGEAIQSIIRAAKLDSLLTDSQKISYIDLEEYQQYSPYIEIADHLSLIPWEEQINFSADKPITQEEVASIVRNIQELSPVEGEIETISLNDGAVIILDNDGEEEEIVITNNTLIFKNMHSRNVESLVPGDDILVISKSNGQAKHITAASTLPDDVVGELGSLIEFFLSPDQLGDLVSGDYSTAITKVESELQEQLNAYGLSEEEVSMIIEQNWDDLREAGSDRVVGTIGNQLQLPPEFVQTIMEQNWDELLGFAQMQIAQEAINQLIQAR